MVMQLIKTLRLALVTALCLAGTAASAAEVESTASPASSAADVELMELDEVVVRGRRIREAIVDAEDDFYKLYNQLNKDDKYDVNCTYLNNPDSPGSRIKVRMCIPVFVADAMTDYAIWKSQCQPPMEDFDEFSCLDRNDDNRLSRQEVSVRLDLDARMFSLDADHDGYLRRDELPEEGFSGPPLYMPPSPDLVLMEGTAKWAKHMMEVINSDPRLSEKAGNLDDLYGELMLTQRRASDLGAEKKENAKKASFRPRIR
jgi:hypothetical protein